MSRYCTLQQLAFSAATLQLSSTAPATTWLGAEQCYCTFVPRSYEAREVGPTATVA